MSMKRNILRFVMALTICAGLTFAQGGKRMADRLGLTPEQKPQVEAILKEQREAMQAARKNNASKTDIQAIRQKTHDRLAGVLNAEQMQKFEKGAKRMHQARKPKA